MKFKDWLGKTQYGWYKYSLVLPLFPCMGYLICPFLLWDFSDVINILGSGVMYRYIVLCYSVQLIIFIHWIMTKKKIEIKVSGK